MADSRTSNAHDNIVRRSGNYKPTIWHFDYVQSLQSKYVGEPYTRRVDKLKAKVRVMLEKVENPLAQLEQINAVQRLGLSYHFESEIRMVLKEIYGTISCNDDAWKKKDLYATALEFKLLRQHGYLVSSDVFNVFKNETGCFKACVFEDVVGMLSLYEASFHSMKGENILEEARDFTKKHLEEFMKRNKDRSDDDLVILVGHALELPLHWRMLRMEARWFIDVYGKRHDMNPTFLELAKLDFNMVQSTYLEDLKHASRWWNSTSLGQMLPFARDRLVETFLWTVGVRFEPEFGYCKRMLTRVGVLITLIDDIYDVYATLDELKRFEDALERWDINYLDQLPDYMKLCFIATYNAVNEMVYDVLKDQGHLVIKYLKKTWTDICKTYMVEAKWYYSGYTPTLQEYIENGWISSTIPLILVHLYCFITNPITEEAMECLVEYPSIIRDSSIICRLVDDLGTSSVELQRGDNPKSIQCYMHEKGVSENDARQHIKSLISETWKQMNEDRVAKSPFSQAFTETATNIVRMAMLMYQNGDGHGAHQDLYTKDIILSLFVNPIPLEHEHVDH